MFDSIFADFDSIFDYTGCERECQISFWCSISISRITWKQKIGQNFSSSMGWNWKAVIEFTKFDYSIIVLTSIYFRFDLFDSISINNTPTGNLPRPSLYIRNITQISKSMEYNKLTDWSSQCKWLAIVCRSRPLLFSYSPRLSFPTHLTQRACPG